MEEGREVEGAGHALQGRRLSLSLALHLNRLFSHHSHQLLMKLLAVLYGDRGQLPYYGLAVSPDFRPEIEISDPLAVNAATPLARRPPPAIQRSYLLVKGLKSFKKFLDNQATQETYGQNERT